MLRNNIIDFLVSRSRTFLAEMGRQLDPRHVPVVRLRGRSAAGSDHSSEQMVLKTGHEETIMKPSRLTEKFLTSSVRRVGRWKIHLRPDRRHVADADTSVSLGQ